MNVEHVLPGRTPDFDSDWDALVDASLSHRYIVVPSLSLPSYTCDDDVGLVCEDVCLTGPSRSPSPDNSLHGTLEEEEDSPCEEGLGNQPVTEKGNITKPEGECETSGETSSKLSGPSVEHSVEPSTAPSTEPSTEPGSSPANPIPVDELGHVTTRCSAIRSDIPTPSADIFTQKTGDDDQIQDDQAASSSSHMYDELSSRTMAMRKNRPKRILEDMAPWGDPEYESAAQEELSAAWSNLEPRWEAFQEVMCRVTERLSDRALSRLCARLSDAVQEAYDNLDIETAQMLSSCWEKVEVRIRVLALYVAEFKHDVTQFDRCVRELLYQAEICDALHTPPCDGSKRRKRRRAN